eukprot:m.105252 g.105252  ORF g.105252 m.105252 type:complete len:602 (+) comp13276_c0_seq1:229-2034(+)
MLLMNGQACFQPGSRVIFTNKHPGTVRYFGTVSFRTGLWVGVELDESVGKNDGSVHGVRYFKCASGHGVFAQPEKFCARPNVSVGSKVVLKGKHVGVIKYLGKTDLGPGEWVGLELKERVGKHNGFVQGQRYFECPPGHGVFARLSHVSLATTSKSASMKAKQQALDNAVSPPESPVPAPPVEEQLVQQSMAMKLLLEENAALKQRVSELEAHCDAKPVVEHHDVQESFTQTDEGHALVLGAFPSSASGSECVSAEGSGANNDSSEVNDNDASSPSLATASKSETGTEAVLVTAQPSQSQPAPLSSEAPRSPIKLARPEFMNRPDPPLYGNLAGFSSNVVITKDDTPVVKLLKYEVVFQSRKILDLLRSLDMMDEALGAAIRRERHLLKFLRQYKQSYNEATWALEDKAMREATLEAELEALREEFEELDNRLSLTQMDLLDAKTDQFTAMAESDMYREEMRSMRTRLRELEKQAKEASAASAGTSVSSTAHTVAESQRSADGQSVPSADDDMEGDGDQAASHDDEGDQDEEEGLGEVGDLLDEGDSVSLGSAAMYEGVLESPHRSSVSEAMIAREEEELWCEICEDYGHLAEDCDDTITF